ncbi:MAG: amino acid transporter [Pirellulaceae bacterium]|nr:MAG: amino acid transporter [Pirellulaceae bacterium]
MLELSVVNPWQKGTALNEQVCDASEPRRALGLFDAICLTVGVIVGVGIYQTAPEVAKAAVFPWQVYAFWLVGGLLTLAGACCYAELASAYPKDGGDYVYLSRAYGPWAGFLFAWFQCTLIRPGDIALVSWVFAHHLLLLVRTRHSDWQQWGVSSWHTAWVACCSVVVLTLFHSRGIVTGKWLQNILTLAKLAGIVWLVGVAAAPAGGEAVPAASSSVVELPALPATVAIILVLFTYGGWSDAALVAAEVRRPERNIFRALVGGTVLVTVIYLAMNGAFLRVLGHAQMAGSSAVAEDMLKAAGTAKAAAWINALICVSALGCASGMVLTGARISYALGADHPALAWLGRWNTRPGAPRHALALQAAATCAMLLLLRDFLDTLMYTSAAVYGFYTATSLAVIVLRRKEPNVPRPYRVTGYPVTVLVFAATSLYLMYSALMYRPWHALAMVVYLAVGLLLYRLQIIWPSRGPKS